MPYQDFPHYIDETPGVKHYCACGESKNKPWCDGSHASTSTGKEPVKFEVTEKKRMAICDCGKTKNSPLCDGSHSA